MTHCRSSTVEVLTDDGLSVVQTIQAVAPILDVSFHEDIMYIALDVKEGNWIAEYRSAQGVWTVVDTGDKWRLTTREKNNVEVYWLESMRKRAGVPDDE